MSGTDQQRRFRRVVPFEVTVAQGVLDDLAARLAMTRFPPEPDGGNWQRGTRPAYTRRVVDHWLTGFDWRVWEAKINAFPNYVADVEGHSIHVIVEPASRAGAPALLLTHGWPGSIVEFIYIIDRLAHPERHGGRLEDAVTVVVPSIPGYGFSSAPPAPIGPREVARLWHGLMTENLGFAQFFAQGGDWGSFITSWLAHDFPDCLHAIHLNFASLSQKPGDGAPLDEAEKDWMARFVATREDTGAYRSIQATRPMTLSHALTDSPTGLAAWILEKFHGWTIPSEDRDPPFDLDVMLANIMLYWLPGPGAASWLYASMTDGTERHLPEGSRISVPTSFLLCPHDLVPPPPRQWLERVYEIETYDVAQTGGHFLALEQPDLFVDAVQEFLRRAR